MNNAFERAGWREAMFCMLAPVAVIGVGRFVGPFVEPGAARASPGLVGAETVTIAEPILATPTDEIEAIEASKTRLLALGDASPFASQDEDEPAVQVVVTGPILEPEPFDEPGNSPALEAPPILVSSIVRGARPIAVIDGSIRRVGDRVIDGWVLVDIDAAGRRVRVAHPEGGSAWVDLATP